MLAGGADEHPGEQIRQRRVVMPVTDQTSQQIGPAQKRAVCGSRAADHDVVAPAGSAVLAVHHELLRAQPALAREIVERRGVFAPARPKTLPDGRSLR